MALQEDAAVKLRTVNDGEIRVEQVAGDFDLENINGGIALVEASGSGRAHTVSGKISASFRANP